MTSKQAYIQKASDQRYYRLETIARSLGREHITDPLLWQEINMLRAGNYLDDVELFQDKK